MTLRCLLDGLLLDATLTEGESGLIAYDGDEGFSVEAVETLFYELVSASGSELLGLEQARYRLLRRANDFVCAGIGTELSREQDNNS